MTKLIIVKCKKKLTEVKDGIPNCSSEYEQIVYNLYPEDRVTLLDNDPPVSINVYPFVETGK